MSPPRAPCAPSEAPWEIIESECIDFALPVSPPPAPTPPLPLSHFLQQKRGSCPDEELRRKCNNLILLQSSPLPSLPPTSIPSFVFLNNCVASRCKWVRRPPKFKWSQLPSLRQESAGPLLPGCHRLWPCGIAGRSRFYTIPVLRGIDLFPSPPSPLNISPSDTEP